MARASATTIENYLSTLWDKKGTDILFTAGSPPLLRIDGVLSPMDGAPSLSPADTEKIVAGVLTEDMATQFKAFKELDFSFNWKSISRFRANVFLQRGSMAMALRLIPYAIPSFEELGLPDVVENFVKLPQGLVLVTGPTGAGKSTTLASMIDYINDHRACHILTIEDPIEYVHRHKKAAVNQREIGEDTSSFARALRSALREDPDVLLVGEMRDLETIQTALTIAETGHLVFATLHTNDTAQALDRIVDVFPGEYQTQIRVQLANCLAGVMYQQLMPRVGGGRVAAFEVMVATHPVRNLIKEGKTRQLRNVVATGQRDGMQTYEASLTHLLGAGFITYDEAISRSLYPGEIKAPKSDDEGLPKRRLRH
ncbi:MAG: type IV pilus twitching motility protein PilT [Actinomycetota bacterium]|nr:type IV pilus twitching motility protein PilT [Actinomycetota bacterium]